MALGGPYLGNPTNISVDLFFSGDPGAIEIDVQFANADVDAEYATPDSSYEIIAVSATPNFSAHFDGPYPNAKFMRLKSVTITNSVKVTAVVKR